GSAEPAAWSYETTDSTDQLQAAGGVGFRAYLSGTPTTAPVTVRFDDFQVTAATSSAPAPVANPTPTPTPTPAAPAAKPAATPQATPKRRATTAPTHAPTGA